MNKTIIGGLLLGVICGTALADGQENVSALVQTSAVRRMELYTRVSGYGTVAPGPGATVNLNFPKAGEVTRLLVAPGQRVKRGAILLDITTAPSGTLAFDQAENAVVYAKGELARTQSLYQQQLATRSQVESAARALRDAEAALAAVRGTGQDIRHDRLLAPFDGTIASIAVASGDRFQPDTNLMQISRNGFMEARLGIEPDDSRQVTRGLAVRLASVFNPAEVVQGEVRQVTGQIDPQTQLVNVLVRFHGNLFLPGTRVEGDIAVGGHEAQAVPRQAVLRDNNGAYLFQVRDGKAHRVDVKTGLEDGNWTEIVSPALPELPVVKLGNYELEDGMAVRESGQ